MKKIIILTLMTIALSGCLRNVSLDGLASTGGATAGATLGSLISPTTAVIGGIAGGVATDLATPAPETSPDNFAGQDGELSFTELLAFMWYNFTSHIITISIVAGLLWILTGYLGLRMKRPEERKTEELLNKVIEKQHILK